MCERTVLEDPGTLVLIPDQHKTHKICNEAFDYDPDILELVPDKYKTQ